MRNAETNIMNAVMLELSIHGAMVWRNQVGKFRTFDGRIVSIGVTGSPDIYAAFPVVITPEMVGKTIMELVAVEVKTSTGILSSRSAYLLCIWPEHSPQSARPCTIFHG